MCGIFGIFSKNNVDKKSLVFLANHARQRGRDSSGLIFFRSNTYQVSRADCDISSLLKSTPPFPSNLVFGHSRLITNGLNDNQPIVREGILVMHNGIIVNHDELWKTIASERNLDIDTEIIAAIAEVHLKNGGDFSALPSLILNQCKGTISAAVLLPKLGKALFFSNNGSLYVGFKDEDLYFSSEIFPLNQLGCRNTLQIKDDCYIFDIPLAVKTEINDGVRRIENLIPPFSYIKSEDKLLSYEKPFLKRCSKCVLPETMPFIKFDSRGVCNYCNSYKLRNRPKPKNELFELVSPYRRKEGIECIVPFSGGRDSCYGLHLIVNELKLRPITYTYDWGMVTDLGRRNISRMCSMVGVENIIVAADISKKRRNIRMNLEAWLRSPHLGMMAMLTAGDKHFFRHVETVKKQTGVSLNLWGVNPLEVTHFKKGFLGIPPDFEERRVYSHGLINQLEYHGKRTKAMLESPKYFNRSLWDTLSGEYFRSFTEKKDYFHIFDYWRWDEAEVDNTLLETYEWEKSPDTTTTWRIGDGTAAFYNYVYYTVAGFTEHDTFRSNQIREGDLTREQALILIERENIPRYQNIRWYLDAIGMNFTEVIKVVNSIPKLYH